MPGPAPKHPNVRARRNKKSTAAKLGVKRDVSGKKKAIRRRGKKAGVRPAAVTRPQLPARACECGGPKEPPKRRGGPKKRGRPRKASKPCATCGGTGILPWHFLVKRWWDDIWTSPMSEEWHESDIHKLYMVAFLMEQFYVTGGVDTKLAGEIRLQLQPFGLTPLDRRKLDWEFVEDPGEAKPVNKPKAEEEAPPVPMPDPRLLPETMGKPN